MFECDFDTVASWVQSMTDCSIPKAGAITIGFRNSCSDMVAGVMYEHFTGTSITATIAIAPGVIVPRGFIAAIFDYPFVQLRCRKILAYVEVANQRSRSMVERMGFEKEAVVRDVFPSGAMIVYSLTPEKCRYLEKAHGKKDENATCS